MGDLGGAGVNPGRPRLMRQHRHYTKHTTAIRVGTGTPQDLIGHSVSTSLLWTHTVLNSLCRKLPPRRIARPDRTTS